VGRPRKPACQPDHSLHVIGEIGEADYHCRPDQPDGADDKRHRPLLPGEDMPGGVRCPPCADQAMGTVDADMVLVAKGEPGFTN